MAAEEQKKYNKLLQTIAPESFGSKHKFMKDKSMEDDMMEIDHGMEMNQKLSLVLDKALT